MARRQTDGACAEAGLQAARTLLLVPEAPLIAILLVLYLALGQPPLLGVAVALLIISFIARCLALIGARASHPAARYREAEVLSQIALALNPWSADALALPLSASSQAKRRGARQTTAVRFISSRIIVQRAGG